MTTEIERGRSEAAHTRVKPTDVQPYLSPPPDTAYPLRYAFYVLGDIRGKTVLDLGCGSGENVTPLLARGAQVIAIDLSPELLELAKERVALSNFPLPVFMVGSALDIPIPDASIDVVLCASLLHHLDIPRAMAEIRRVLRPGGSVVVKEPVRFSRTIKRLRKLFPAREDISDDEHPLTREEMTQVKAGWQVAGERAFRLPFVPLLSRKKTIHTVWKFDQALLKRLSFLERYSTTRVLKLTRAD
jgi:SAM-dependent methyltransferase